MIVKKIIYTVFLFVIVSLAHAQILDDSTKQIYGTNTTKFFTEKEVSHLNIQKHSIDTSLVNYHQWEYLFDNKGQFYQDLGAIGSASQSMYYQIHAEQVGKQLGRDAFSLFSQKNNEVKYYDTKSPHSSFNYQQGGNGQAKLDAMYTQNVKENINFGLTFRRFSAIDQIGKNTKKNPFTNHYSAQLFTSIQSKNKRYHLLANYRFLNHTVHEKGGIYRDSIDVQYTDSLFNEYEFAYLSGVRVQDRRNNYHVYHHYQVFDSSKAVYIFHEFDREKQVNLYEDKNVSTTRTSIDGKSNADFYNNQLFFSPTKMMDSTVYQLFQNKIGLKGKIAGVYYEGFYKQRNYRFRHYFEENPAFTNESYLGGALERTVNEKYLVNASFQISPQGYYLANATASYKTLKIGYLASGQPSTIFQDRYFSNHIQWINSFDKNVLSSQIYGEITLKHKETYLKPFFDVTNVSNFIYIGKDTLFYQNESAMQLLNIGVDAKLKVKNWYFREFLKYAQSSNSAYKVPRINSLSQIYWQKPISLISKKEAAYSGKKKYLLVQIGADVFYKSGYYANAYLPVTQQFYLQDGIKTQDYWVSDVFVNIQLKRIRSFFKVSHVNQFNKGYARSGYQTTPDYAGKRRVFEFGVGWMFFD